MLKSIVMFLEAGRTVVSTPEFEFAGFTKMESFNEVATLKDKLTWTKDDFAAFQEKTRTEISSLTATAA
jgi:hypothetical protein